MNSWEELACYPQSTFYPLSDGPSIQNHRITMTYFRTCSTCGSRSQARFCHCTLWAMSDRPKRTFVLLRYLLGGDRPSQTAYHARSPIRIHGPRLEPQTNQGGISRLTPPKLASRLTVSHLSYTNRFKVQCKATVKVHGVFPSSRG